MHIRIFQLLLISWRLDMVVGLESFQVPGALVVLELPVLALQGFRGQFLYF